MSGPRRWAALAGLGLLLIAPASANAEKVTLKSGLTVEGKLVRNDKDFIVLDRDGVLLIYLIDNIAAFEGAKLKRRPGDKPAAGAGAGAAVSSQLARQSRPFKTAMVTYRLSGDTEGSETLWIDGDKIAVEQFITRQEGQAIQRSTLLLDDGRDLVQVDLDAKQATRTRLGGGEGIIGYFEGEMSDPGAYTMREGMHLGLPCRVYEISPGKNPAYANYRTHTLYFHKNLLLKRETDFSFASNDVALDIHELKEAIDVQFDVPIPPAKLALPEGVSAP